MPLKISLLIKIIYDTVGVFIIVSVLTQTIHS